MNGLTSHQVNDLKETLQSRFDDLTKIVRQELIRSEDENYVKLAESVHDSGEESVADLLFDTSLAVIDLHIQEISDIEKALQRISVHSYNGCQDCEGEIGYKRLAAYPTAKRCIKCQAMHEKTFDMPPHSSL